MALESVGEEIKQSPGNGGHCFPIHGGYGQLCIFCPTEERTKLLENKIE
jgi:hypothetical protein